MASHHPHFFDIRLVGFLLGAALVLVPGLDVAEASDGAVLITEELSVPAEHVYSLRLPGMEDHIRRPSALFVDHAHGEVLVGDAGLNRLVIFDSEGLYRFQFDFADQVGAVADLAVDSDGFVYILGSSAGGRRVLRYDFDGVLLNEVTFDDLDARRLESLTLDDSGRLVMIDVTGRCFVADATGQVIRQFDTMTGLSEEEALGVVRGSPRVRGNRMYVPFSTLGSVLVFDLESGEALEPIGYKGNTVGQFNFPVAVDILPSGIIIVLDKMRFNVLCFAPSGRFLGEFGGKGYRDGWFYHPSLLAALSEDQVIVGQILDHRVQMLRVPEFVFERLPREPEQDSDGTVRGSDVLSESDPRSP